MGRFMARVGVKFRVRIRVWAWSGVTLLAQLTLCRGTFCSDPPPPSLWVTGLFARKTIRSLELSLRVARICAR